MINEKWHENWKAIYSVFSWYHYSLDTLIKKMRQKGNFHSNMCTASKKSNYFTL